MFESDFNMSYSRFGGGLVSPLRASPTHFLYEAIQDTPCRTDDRSITQNMTFDEILDLSHGN